MADPATFGIVGAFLVNTAISMAVSAVLSWIFPTQIKGPRLTDLNVTGQGYGPPIPKCYGKIKSPGAVIWASDLIEKKKKTGGKGGGSSTTTYTYSQHVAIAACEGEAQILRIWAGGKLIWAFDPSEYSAKQVKSVQKIIPAENVTVYSGSQTQGVDPTIESYLGVGETSAYRGTCYVVLKNLQLADWGNRTPPFMLEVAAGIISTEPSALETIGEGSSKGCYNPDLDRYVCVVSGAATATGNTTVDIDLYETDPNTQTNTRQLHYLTPADDYSSNDCDICYVNSLREYWVVIGSYGENIYIFDADSLTYKTRIAKSGTWYERMHFNQKTGVVWIGKSNLSATVIAIRASDRVTLNTVNLETSEYILGFDTTPDGGTLVYYSGGLAYFNSASALVTDYKTNTFLSNTELRYYTYDRKRNRVYLAHQHEPPDLWVLQFGTNALPMFGSKNIFTFNGGTWSSVTIAGIGSYPSYSPLGIKYNSVSDRILLDLDNTWYVINAETMLLEKTNVYSISVNIWNRHIEVPGVGDYIAVFPHGGGQYNAAGVYHVPLFDTYRFTANNVTLAAVCKDICESRGLLDPAQIDVTGLTGNVDGYAIANPSSARDALEPLRTAYWFDWFESGSTIKFKMRGGDSVAELTAADLGAKEGTEPAQDLLNISRGAEEELPYRVEIHHYRKGSEYEEGVQADQVVNTSAREMVSLDLPIVLGDYKARDAASVALYTSRLERTGYSFTTSRKWSHLEPADVIGVTVGTYRYRMRITEKDEGGGLIKFKAVPDEQSYYPGIGSDGLSSAFYLATDGLTGGSIVDSGSNSSVLFDAAINYARFLDLPPLLASHTGLGIYQSTTANRADPTDTWDGAINYYSIDGGVSFEEGTTILTEATVAQTTSVLGNFTGTSAQVDMINQLTLEVAGDLESVSYDLFLAGRNAILVGNEIVGFQNAVLLGLASNGINYNYRLSKLLRGQRGTEQYISGHTTGEICVLLDSAVVRLKEPETVLGLAMTYRVAGNGDDLDDVENTLATNTGVCLKPFSPVNLRGLKSAAASWNINLSWNRRDRLTYDIQNGSDIPMSEDAELYEVEIYTTDFVTLKRTVTGLSVPDYSYSNADQVTDFGSTQSSIGVKVYQISGAVGRGFPGSAVVTAI